MKTIKSIIFVALILSSYALSVERTERRKTLIKSTASAYDGDGSWDKGFNSPGFLIEIGKTAFNNDNRKGMGKFLAPKLENPSTEEEKIGWVFDMTKQLPTENLLKVMVRIGTTNNYYIPFRWLSTNFGYTNPLGYKYIEGMITNDAKDTYHLRLLLPFTLTSYFINDNEGNKIARILNMKRIEHQGIVNSKKSGANSAANSYISNKPLHISATGSAVALKAEQDKQRSLTVTIAEEQKVKQTAYEKTSAEISVIEVQLLSLKRTQLVLRENISSISNQIDVINAGLNFSKTNSAAEQAKTYKLAVDTAEKELKENINDLKVEAPVRIADLDIAQTSILVKLNKAEFDASLNKVSP